MILTGDKDFDKHELGIVKGVTFGLRDCGRPVLSFSVSCYPCTGSLQIFEGDDIKTLLTRDYSGASIYIAEIAELEGKPIVVKGNGLGSRVFVVGLWTP